RALSAIALTWTWNDPLSAATGGGEGRVGTAAGASALFSVARGTGVGCVGATRTGVSTAVGVGAAAGAGAASPLASLSQNVTSTSSLLPAAPGVGTGSRTTRPS